MSIKNGLTQWNGAEPGGIERTERRVQFAVCTQPMWFWENKAFPTQKDFREQMKTTAPYHLKLIFLFPAWNNAPA